MCGKNDVDSLTKKKWDSRTGDETNRAMAALGGAFRAAVKRAGTASWRGAGWPRAAVGGCSAGWHLQTVRRQSFKPNWSKVCSSLQV